MIFNHVTDYNNLKSILKNGLIPQVGDRSKLLNEEESIFLFKDYDVMCDCVSNWDDFYDEDTRLVLLQIDLTEKELINLSSEGCADYEIKYLKKINPQSITLLNDNF